MATLFDSIEFNLSAAEAEFESFVSWFSTLRYSGERPIVSEVRKRPHMCCLLASLGSLSAPNLIRYELTLQGLFRTDLALGIAETRQFALIEFEDAKENSIFAGGFRQCRSWARRLEHGIGQAVDWAWLIADQSNATVLTNAFGGMINHSAYIVVCGRDTSLADEMERRRFEFRRHRMHIEGVPLQIVTYDGMIEAMRRQLEAIKSYVPSL